MLAEGLWKRLPMFSQRPFAALHRSFLSQRVQPFSPVPNTKVAEVARMLKAIHAHEHRKAAEMKVAQVVVTLKAMKLKTAAELVEHKVSETMTYCAYPGTIGDSCAPIIHSSALFVRSEDAPESLGLSPTDTRH
jgi:hypothetical protein